MVDLKRYQHLEITVTAFSHNDVITASVADGVGIEWNTDKWGGSFGA